MSSTCKPAISTPTTLNQTMPLRFFASSRTLYSLENTLSIKTSTKIIFDLLQRQEIATLSLPKKAAIANISPTFRIVNTYASSMRSRVSYRFQINSSYTCGRAKTIRVDAKCFENGEKKVAFSNEYGYQWTGH